MRKISRAEEFNPWINVHTAEHEICPCGEHAVGSDRHGRPACAQHAAPHAPFVEGSHLPINAFEITPEDRLRMSLSSKTASIESIQSMGFKIIAKDKKDGGEKTFTPPAGVQSAARHALKLIEDGKAGDGFTSVGRGRAHQLANGESVSMTVIKKMHSYFARHNVDKKGKGWGKDSPGYVAWLAWGGDAGRKWVNGIMRDHGDNDNESKKKEGSVVIANQYIKHRGNKWVILNKEGEVLSHHDSEEKAEEAFAAMMANKHKHGK